MRLATHVQGQRKDAADQRWWSAYRKQSLTLDGIPTDAHRYKLGNRSALDWIISQYHSVDADPNWDDDKEYITRLIWQVIRVSIDTLVIIDTLDS